MLLGVPGYRILTKPDRILTKPEPIRQARLTICPLTS